MSGRSPRRPERLLTGELSPKEAAEIEALGMELYGRPIGDSKVLRAILACRAGARPEELARALDWKEFEAFSADLLRARGYRVEQNVMLRRPRAQVDIVARLGGGALAVDCKHWRRPAGAAFLAKQVEEQRRRARLLRSRLDETGPIVSVILTLSEGSVRFVGGGAVVPIRTLASFLEELPGLTELVEFD